MSVTVEKAFSDIENADDRLLGIGAGQISKFIRLFEESLLKYRQWKGLTTAYTLEQFITECSRDNCRRGEILALEYYEQNGEYERNSRFLFGTASQFRRPARAG